MQIIYIVNTVMVFGGEVERGGVLFLTAVQSQVLISLKGDHSLDQRNIDWLFLFFLFCQQPCLW